MTQPGIDEAVMEGAADVPLTLARVLEDCILAVLAGRSIDAVLADHPAEASQLRPLLDSALALRDGPGSAASPGLHAMLAQSPEAIEAQLAARRSLLPRAGTAKVMPTMTGLIAVAVVAIALLAVTAAWPATRIQRTPEGQGEPSTQILGRETSRPGADENRDHMASPTLVLRRGSPLESLQGPASVSAQAGVAGDADGLAAQQEGLRAGRQAAAREGAGSGPRTTLVRSTATVLSKVLSQPTATMVPTEPSLPPTSEPPADEETDAPPERSTDRPPAPATTAPEPAPGGASIAGRVWQMADGQELPLTGMTVWLVAADSQGCSERSGRDPEPVTTVTSDALGHFVFAGLEPGSAWWIGAEGGSRCLVRRWHNGPREPGALRACDSLRIGLDAAQSTDQANVVFEAGAGVEPACPAATP